MRIIRPSSTLTMTTTTTSTVKATTTTRKIEKIIPATPSGPINRLIGTVDIDGRGTNHPLPQVDPFMLLDQVTMSKTEMPPFGDHPHRGHSVVTILMQGQEKSWDSFTQKETIVHGPASYWVDAGSGIFHDETTFIPDESDPTKHVSLFQLWISVKEEDRSKTASLQYDTNLPVKEAKNMEGDVIGSIRYFVGGGGSIQTIHPVIVSHISQKPGTTLRIPIDPHYGGFVVNLAGSSYVDPNSQPATFAGTVQPNHCNDVLVLENNNDETSETTDQYLEVTTSQDAPSDYLLCVGERIGEPWYKKLVANGAIIASSPDEAREIATNVETYASAGKREGGSFAPFGK